MATLDAPKLLVLTNQTKLTLTVALTLTDTAVTVIFLTRISSKPIKRLYRNNKRFFCGGATVQETIDDIILCDVYIFLHFYCYGMRSVILQINKYDDDDDAGWALFPFSDF